MSQAICVLQPFLLVNTILSSTYWLFLLLLDFCLKPNTAHHFNPPPQLCRISPSLILILLPLFSLLLHSKVPVQELYKEERGGGWVGGGRHGFLTIATDKRLQSIEEFPHISWIIGASENGSCTKQTLDIIRTLAGAGAPLPFSSFLPFIFNFFLTEWGSCFLSAYSPLQFHSPLVPALFPLFPLLSFSEKESLCVTPFLAPLCYAVHIVTQWKAESRLWVWSSETFQSCW